jgi:hypothetical protein
MISQSLIESTFGRRWKLKKISGQSPRKHLVMGMAIKQECSVPTEAWVSLAKQINAS